MIRVTKSPVPWQHHSGRSDLSSAKYLFPNILTPNSGDDRFRTCRFVPTDNEEFTVRIDQQLTNKQRIYGRYVISDFTESSVIIGQMSLETTVQSSKAWD